MAHKKAGGSSRNGRDSAGRRLGVNHLLFYVLFCFSLVFSQFFGLFDLAFTLDSTFERQLLVEVCDIISTPSSDLSEGCHAICVQLLLKRRSDT